MLPHQSCDIEVKTLADMIQQGKWQTWELPQIEQKIRTIRAKNEAGLYSATARYWTSRMQQYDPQLRLRWDFSQGWVVERAVPEWECWVICGVLGMRCVPENLMAILRKGDMQRYTPSEYLAMRREQAQEIRDANEKRSNNAVLSAVDKLTDKRCKEFLQVEQAVRSGETIVAHGDTEKSLDRMRQASFRAREAGEYRE